MAAMLVVLSAYSQDKADILILHNKYKEAHAEIDKQIGDNPTAALLYKKGVVYKLQQQYQQAAQSFFAASEMDNQSPEILGELAETLNLLDNTEDAARVYTEACRLAPKNLELAAKLGSTYIVLRNYKDALKVFNTIYQADSTNVYWNKQYAFCLARARGNDSLAIRLYEKVADVNPRDISNYSSLSTLYLRQEKFQKAKEALERGLAIFPDNPDLVLKMANFNFGRKSYTEAVEWFAKYASIGEIDYDTQKNYGIALYLSKNDEKALEILTECMFANPNDPIVMFYQSLCYKKLADYKTAEGFMKSAIEAASPYYVPDMYHHLGQIYNQERKFEESIGAYQKSYELDTTNFEVLFEIATTYEELSTNKTLALNYYREYLIRGGEAVKNANYALTRIERIKEDLFFKESGNPK
jgi:tetratricopeptide (TPR) repeat protein